MGQKCQKCVKAATYHITEIERGKPRELHFCDEHARVYLTGPGESAETNIGALAQGLVKGGAVRESAVDKQTCPNCQITFLEFRNTGRLGCPNDYEVFRDELMPLLENIHEETRHAGKAPRRAPKTSQRQGEVLDLRNKLKRAIAAEDYEAAARFRDQIKDLEED